MTEKSKKEVKAVWEKFKCRHGENSMGITAVLRCCIIFLLAAIFVTLKCYGMIDWSWVWVLSPLWIPVCFFLLMFAILLIGGLIIVGKSEVCNPASEVKDLEWKKEMEKEICVDIKKGGEDEKKCEKKEKEKEEIKKPRKPKSRPKKKVAVKKDKE